jgi:pimeloyl-ACP methyl ester carboxylesterase
MAAAIPGCRAVVVSDAGHDVHLDQPDALAEEVESFLDSALDGLDVR